MATERKVRLATVWLGGCSGCHMSLLDLDDYLLELAARVELVYGPLVDAKDFPSDVAITLVEGAVATVAHLELLGKIRERSAVLASFGDCAVTGNVTALRNCGKLDAMLAASGPGAERLVPALLPKILPLHHVTTVEVFIPGCPPDPERIRAALDALLRGEPVRLSEQQRTFG